MLANCKQAPQQHFSFAAYLNKEISEPRKETVQINSLSKRPRYEFMKADTPELSRLFKNVYVEIEKFLPEIKVTAASNVQLALNQLGEKFTELIKATALDLLSETKIGQLNLKNPDPFGAITLFAGGLHNAMQIYLALGKVAY